MTLTSSSGTVKFYKGQIKLTESDIIGTWENYQYIGGYKLELNADHTFKYTWYETDASIKGVAEGYWEFHSTGLYIEESDGGSFSFMIPTGSAEGPYFIWTAAKDFFYVYKTA